MPEHYGSGGAAKISALAGLLAGIAAIAVGCMFLIFALPPIGRPGKVCGKGCGQEDQYHPSVSADGLKVRVLQPDGMDEGIGEAGIAEELG